MICGGGCGGEPTDEVRSTLTLPTDSVSSRRLAAGVHTDLCLTQSLCWQYAPQYRATAHPLHAWPAFRPQFQQFCNKPFTVTSTKASLVKPVQFILHAPFFCRAVCIKFILTAAVLREAGHLNSEMNTCGLSSCFCSSRIVFSICSRSAVTADIAFCSAAKTAFCNSETAAFFSC